ncbi:MAG: hypothetical protein DRI44_04665 [Chlamydiae bacterium]|nr:MAG: hypothetical protein DRI44_04665 [Chlamydiota bacterium]
MTRKRRINPETLTELMLYVIESESKESNNYLTDQDIHGSESYHGSENGLNKYLTKFKDQIQQKIEESVNRIVFSKDLRMNEILSTEPDLFEKYKDNLNRSIYYERVQQRNLLLLTKSRNVSRLYPTRNTAIITTLQPHPINLDIIEKIYRREPIVAAAIEERAEEVIQPGFDIECDNKQAREILIDFRESSYIKFDEKMKNALINYFLYGNNYLQPVVMDNEVVKLFNMDPRYMFVETDYRRNVYGYWEFSAYAQEFFFPYEIIQWKRNATVEDPYGYSVIHPLVEYVKRKLNVWADAIKALHRYGSPKNLWIFGNEKIPRIPKAQITNFINDLKSHPSNDVGVPYGVDAKTLGGDYRVALNFIDYLEELRTEIMSALRVPPVALGIGKSEAQSSQNLEAFDKRNQTTQYLLSTNVIIPLFRLILDLQGIGIRKAKKINIRWNRFERIERSKKEQNIVKMSMSGIITPNEARKMIGISQPIKAFDPIENKEIPHYGDMFIYPMQQNVTTGSVGQTFNSNKVNPQTDRTKTRNKVSKQ